MEENQIHLICSSGGVKCLSYIGAFDMLQKNGMTIASVSACSMGTVLGALFCSGVDIKILEQKILEFDFTQIKKRKSLWFAKQFVYPFAPFHTPDYANIIISLIGRDPKLGEMAIPFSAAALDIRQKRFLVYSSKTHPDMKVSEVVRIATSIPFLFEPYKLDKHILVDAAIASESPVWMAAANMDSNPIVILKPNNLPSAKFKHGISNFLSQLFMASSGSHDDFAGSQTPRSIEIKIDCEDIAYDDFNISREQIENLIVQGQEAVRKKLKEHQNNFNHRLEVEEIGNDHEMLNHADIAAQLASKLYHNYQAENINRNQVFVSYSHKDKDWLTRFQTNLTVIEAFTGVKVWNDRAIQPGENWSNEIIRALRSTKVAIFLVSSNFLASEFIRELEMKYFIELSEQEKVPILWIAVSHCNYEITPLKYIQCANDPEKPLDQLSEADQKQEFKKICNTIMKEMQKSDTQLKMQNAEN
jgi:predicted acylesterase/phospholipase RssA